MMYNKIYLSIKKTIAFSVLTTILSSCTLLYTDYKEPEFVKVESFKGAENFTGDVIKSKFWEDFSDSKLNAIIEKAFEYNFDLRQSYVSVEKALLYFDVTHTNYHPSADATLSDSYKRALDYHDSWAKGSSTNLSLSYQIDLFGKLQAQDQSALESYKASAYDYLAMRLTVIQSVAQAYWQYAYAREVYEIGKQDLEDSKTRLNLVQSQYNLGASDALDLDDARIDALKVEQTLDSREAAFKKAKTALATLLGQGADSDFDVGTLDDATIPNYSLEVPLKLLKNRPDLMSDEATLKKYYADYNQAKMAFFPDLSLSAGLSSGSSNTFGNFFANPIATLGASITMPFLNFNKLNLEQKRAWKDVDLYTIKFIGDYVKAVQEVYDDVVNCDLYYKTVQKAYKTYNLAKENYSRYEIRYRLGSVSMTDLLQAADTMRNAHVSYIGAKQNLLNAHMSLIAALGGDSKDIQISSIIKE